MSSKYYDLDYWEETEPEIACDRCGKAVYWGDHFEPNGDLDRRLFNVGNNRLHDCTAKPDEGVFPS